MYAFLSAFLIFLTVILILPFKVKISFVNRSAVLYLCIGSITVYRRSLRKNERDSENSASPACQAAEVEKDSVSLGKRIKRFKDTFSFSAKLLGKYVSLDLPLLKIDIGTGDAALTAIAVGSLWASIYALIGIMGSLFSIERHNVQINPVYTNSSFNLEGECIFKSRVVNIIFIGITILIKYIPERVRR